jgi:serine protease Do
MKPIFCALTFALVLFGSCSSLSREPRGAKNGEGVPRGTGPSAVAPSYELMKMEELARLSDSDPAAFLEAFAALSAKGPKAEAADDQAAVQAPSPAELSGLAGKAVESIYSDYRAALVAKDRVKALSLIASLAAMAEDPFVAPLLKPEIAAEASRSGEIRAGLYAEEAEDCFTRGLSTPAFLRYEAALEAGRVHASGFDPSELSRWAERAFAARDRSALRVFCSALEAAGKPLPDGAAQFAASRDTLNAMSKGVVTIRVDKGMKIEQGVGVPDRVLGSGFFVDPAGYVLTNYHVIESEVDPKYEGYSHLTIRMSEDPEARIAAKVVGWDRLLDLALLKVDAKPAYVFSLSPEGGFAPGDKILAIGSPVGLENTVTSGIVSAVGRKLLQTGEAIQVDAALNPGNSGGPLVSEAGEAVGIVFAGLSQYQGLNFAISSSWALRILPDLFRGGELKRSWLGLALVESKGGLDVLYRHPRVAEGIDTGDRLVSVDGRETTTLPGAQALLTGRAPVGLVRVRISGSEGDRVLLRRLGERPYSPIEDAFELDRRDRLLVPLFGMEARRQAGTILEPDAYSVVRVWPGTIADEAGLSENDPFALRRFFVDKEQRAAVIQIRVKKRKAGFLESLLQIPAPIDISAFL